MVKKTQQSLNKNSLVQLNVQTEKENFFYSWYSGFLWRTLSKSLNLTRFFKNKKTYFNTFLNPKKELFNKNSKMVINPTFTTVKESSKKDFAYPVCLNIQLQSLLSLGVLYVTKTFMKTFYFCFYLFYQLIFKLIDCMESILFIFYKFLEKPAELMVTWIAEIFLIEWSADLTTYVPEAFDTASWTSLTKFSRSLRSISGIPGGFFLQRFLLQSTESMYVWIIKSDSDLINRQKKGIIFWDIWSEILIQAAEKYKMNLSSLSTVKEEQEILIENLLEQKQLTAENFSNKTITPNKPEKFSSVLLFEKSLIKMKPLTKFLEVSPVELFLRSFYSKKVKMLSLKNNPYKFIQINTLNLYSNFLNVNSTFRDSSFQTNSLIDPSTRWAVNQYLTTQGRDTDLFMDIYPPKSFLHISFLKSYLPAQEILGSLVCEVYSGLFTNKVSKNILIVGSRGNSKSFFIQALAGETELKIVTDNSQRYSLIHGGVPIGMKLLRDVFDSIALHTPCFFLLEDIHIIGERRPMLISDDEISKSKDISFGADQDEVHEKNRFIYQLSRHSLSHYKKPYKGDFSTSVPTNHFCYDLFLGISPPRKRSRDLSTKSPLPLFQIEKELGQSEVLNQNTEIQSLQSKQTLLSSLEISLEQFFAPPATSPFNILLMKEQKKLKPKKIVKEMPWSGLSYDQFMLISKTNYSVRVKVALLAETAMTNLSVKLDMITDLLVIIDSVRSNRGFVVFATTHAPALLDPALRRPGRFDETISLPLLPNLLSRFEIFKTTLKSYSTTVDFLDLSLLSIKTKQNETAISGSIANNLLLLLNSKNTEKRKIHENSFKPNIYSKFFNDYSIYSISQAFQTSELLNSGFINIFKVQSQQYSHSKFKVISNKFQTKSSQKPMSDKITSIIRLTGHDKLNYIPLMYGQAGQFLVESLILNDQTTYALKSFNTFNQPQNNEAYIFKTFFDSNIESKNTLLKLFASKISEFFILNNIGNVNGASVPHPNMGVSSTIKTNHFDFQTNPEGTLYSPEITLFENTRNFQNYWQSAICFLDSLFQKRYLFNKNSIVSEMLFFEDKISLRQPPSPPNSSILMPAKKFENYKRTFNDFIQKPILTIHEKIQNHQKQRFLKLLYNVSVQTSFPTASVQKTADSSRQKSQYTNFYNSFKELGYFDLIMLKPTSSSSFYKQRFLTRHRFSFLNQWWTGQLAEHNVETTYLSHVDWRSKFIESLGDLVLDFPDSDQYYNPRSRRWFLGSTSWGYWLDFEKNLRTEISQHFILQSFAKTSNLLHFNRELLDYLVFRFLRNHSLKELDLIHVLIRFYKNP